MSFEHPTPDVPDVAQVVWNILANSAPQSRRTPCRVCNGTGQTPTIGWRGDGPMIPCWDCDATGSEVAA